VPVQAEPSKSSNLMEEPSVAKPDAMNRPSNKSNKKIGMVHHLGHGNLGDDATLAAVTENIRSRWPGAAVIALTLNPVDTQERHGMPAYSLRRDSKLPPQRFTNDTSAPSRAGFKARVKGWFSQNKSLLAVLRTGNAVIIGRPKALMQEMSFLAESFRVIKSQDVLIVCGGGQLLDSWGGPWGFPYTLFKWIVLARLSGARCYFLNVGAGPLRHPLSKWFIKRALLLSDYVSFRDEDSRKLVHDLGYKGKTQSFPDCAYSLTVPAVRTGRSGGRVVGVSPMAYYDPRRCFDKDQGKYDGYIRSLALFSAWLLRDQHRLMLFSTDIWFDTQAIEDVKAGLRNDTLLPDERSVTSEPVTGMDDLLAQMSAMDCVITSRFHGVIFAHLMNKPVLAISPHPKVTTLMGELGLAEFCLDIRGCDAEVLKKTFVRLETHSEDIKAHMAERVASYKVGLAAQFDALFHAESDIPMLESAALG
jgi:polysaccharide pyruvyl transferase WcaK-like protein